MEREGCAKAVSPPLSGFCHRSSKGDAGAEARRTFAGRRPAPLWEGCSAWQLETAARLALHNVDGEAAAGGFLVFGFHVAAGVEHGADDFVEGDVVGAIAGHGEAGGVDGFDRAHGVAFDARDLDEASDGVAGESEVVLHADLGGVFDLLGGASEKFDEGPGGHGASHAHFSLASHISA